MNEQKARQSLENLGKALQRLGEALKEPTDNSLLIDGTIQRFEFVIELYWKTFKRLLEMEGIQTNTPRESLKKAYEVQWINDDVAWLQMLRDRNETSHVYNEETAKKIYKNIQTYFSELERTYRYLFDRFQGKS
jgi:nucleotidyltransferase substrate binding protein (TIGR01987 family)